MVSENPYDPPRQPARPEGEPLAPTWRRIVSLPLIILGGLIFVCGIITFAVEPVLRHLSERERTGNAFCLLVSTGMVVAGFWLRRRK